MKPFFLVTVAALMLGTDSFAIGNDFDARIDDFKIQEDKKSLDEFRKKDVTDKPKSKSSNITVNRGVKLGSFS